MNDVLAHTLAWTGVLIAVVLLLRRPVARHFGPQVAYALWALPLARLLLPPITLPAWMKPTATVSVMAADDAMLVWEGAGALPPTPAELPQPAGFDLFATLLDLPMFEGLLLVWLGGSAIFLFRRFAAYFDLRDALLADARELGRVRTALRSIRLVETAATTAPLAMGVLDPVIALPPGFMALHDRQARDLALAHELAHHRGGDLLVNVLVQPLFALHWWNPLASYGWLALRRDQEAACDARVMARRDSAERAAYATLIARYAAIPNPASNAALTAPMACPVLGEKSIIHRLRSLSMTDQSPRRRLAGRALLGASLLILPLTATISYAASEIAAVEPPAQPAPPASLEPPAPPAPPEAPEPPEAAEYDGDVEVTEHVWHDADGKERRMKMVFRNGDQEELESKLQDLEASTADRAAMFAETQAGLAEADRALADLPRIMAEAMATADTARATASAQRVIVKRECKPGSDEVSETTSRDGVQIISICHKRVFASARRGLEEAREEIARDREIPEDTRKQLLQTLDRQIERWADKEG